MKTKRNHSPKNSSDLNLIGLSEREEASKVLALAKKQEAAKFANPTLKAEHHIWNNKTATITFVKK